MPQLQETASTTFMDDLDLRPEHVDALVQSQRSDEIEPFQVLDSDSRDSATRPTHTDTTRQYIETIRQRNPPLTNSCIETIESFAQSIPQLGPAPNIHTSRDGHASWAISKRINCTISSLLICIHNRELILYLLSRLLKIFVLRC